MTLEFINEFQITPSISKEINELLRLSFQEVDYQGRDFFKQLPHYRILAKKGDRIIGQLAIDLRMMNLGGSPINVFGVIDLCVHPDLQGEGVGKKLLQKFEAIANEHSHKIDFLFLVTEKSDYYKKLGYQEITSLEVAWLKIDQCENLGMGKELVDDVSFMIKSISAKEWTDNKLDMLGYWY